MPDHWSRIAILACVSLGTLGISVPARAQVGFAVTGRVSEAGSGIGIGSAVLTLGAYGPIVSGPDGSFAFRGVAAGEYTLRVEALSYAPREIAVSVASNVSVSVSLNPSPISLDSILVDTERIDFDGRVRDPALDYFVPDAEVLSNQGHGERTNTGGDFDLDDVYEGVPLRVVIRAFGYLPVDTTFVPDDEGRHTFDLAPDPIVQELIRVQNVRLEERAGDYLYEFRAPLDRTDMARYAGRTTLMSMLRARIPPTMMRLVRCIVVDEEWMDSPTDRAVVLDGLAPEDVERVEFLEIPAQERQLQLRIYTKPFYQQQFGQNDPLAEPRLDSVGCQ